MSRIARADTVGSLLRPDYLKAARKALREGAGSREALTSAEDRGVFEAIAAQEAAGLDVITDGEARRVAWATSVAMLQDLTYLAPMGGTSFVDGSGAGWGGFWRDDSGNALATPQGGRRAVITDKLRVDRDIVQDEYGFLSQHTSFRTKYCFPAPSFHRSYWDPQHSRDAYPTVEGFLQAVRDWIRREVIDRAVALGCDYIQLDAPNYGQTYTDPDVRAVFESEGHDLEAELAFDSELDSSVFDGLSSDITRAIHVCRGNRSGGYWSASGGYETFAPQMFPRLTNIDTLLLEYDSPRAGDFGPLAHVRPDTTVVLGLLTTKHGALETASDLEARITEASRFVPKERLALSTQCGFASGEGGNPLTAEEQQAKLRLVSDLAHRAWA
jgi:5-methyltetrahydropteroyltriglutamate--homocysteine methyltransferase